VTKSLPLVSIVTPSLNQAQFLETAIQSVLKQDYPRIEYIIIDGGSNDNTLDIISKYQDYLAYWVSEKDQGSSDAINKGWQKTTGDYIWVLNADDLLITPGAISALVGYLQQHPDIDFVYGDRYYIDPAGQIVGSKRFPDYDLLKLLLLDKEYPFPGCLMTRQVLETVGYFDNSFLIRNDLDYFLRVARLFNWGHLPEFTACFRIHPAQNSVTTPYMQVQETLHIYRTILCSPDLPPEIKQQKHTIWGVAYYTAADRCFRSGRSAETRYYAIQAIRHFPKWLLDWRLLAELFLSLLGDRGMLWIRAFTLKLYKRRYWNRFD
jgi:glycosyltransferase involved in cell wall biosynthesis